MSLRRCFWGGLAVLCAIICAVAMSSGGATAALDPNSDLLVDKIAEVAFGSVPGDSSGAIDVGIAPAGTIWFRAQSALQFACGVAYSDTARKKLVAIVSDDGAPDGFHRGKWKVGDGAREGGHGSWSVSFPALKNFVKTQVRVAREDAEGAGARAGQHGRSHWHSRTPAHSAGERPAWLAQVPSAKVVYGGGVPGKRSPRRSSLSSTSRT